MSYTSNGIGYQSTETSRLAINTDHLLNVREKVLHFLRTVRVSLTTEQISAALEIPYPSVQPRLSELKNDNLVKVSGDRGETKYGKSCVKWVAVNGQA
jgi:predicted transcriptional regulator|tara:strand:- start:41 stop:334 length:294 start_codon:yes stop_codon:yes gene_type:complete